MNLRAGWLVYSVALCSTGAAFASCSTAAVERVPVALDAAPPLASAPPDVVDGEPPLACERSPVPLRVEMADGYPARAFVEVRHANRPAALLFDTGSSTTFLAVEAGAPDPVRDAGEVTIGACSVRVDGRPYPSEESIGGLRAIGTLGSDSLLSATTELDLGRRLLVRYGDDAIPSEFSAWPTVRFDRVNDLILAHVTVDGKRLRLMVDTGSPHILWLGEQGQPGDTPYVTRDAIGNDLTFHLGRATLELASGVTDTVPIPPSEQRGPERSRALCCARRLRLARSATSRRPRSVDRRCRTASVSRRLSQARRIRGGQRARLFVRYRFRRRRARASVAQAFARNCR